MGVAADLAAIKGILSAGLDDAPLSLPNRQFTPPKKTTDPAAPASWYRGDVFYDEGTGDEGSTEELSFERDVMRRGDVIIGCWVEPQSGEARVVEMVDKAGDLFDDASTATLQFLRPHVERVGLAEDHAGELWWGWEVRVRFMAQDP